MVAWRLSRRCRFTVGGGAQVWCGVIGRVIGELTWVVGTRDRPWWMEGRQVTGTPRRPWAGRAGGARVRAVRRGGVLVAGSILLDRTAVRGRRVYVTPVVSLCPRTGLEALEDGVAPGHSRRRDAAADVSRPA